MDNKLLIKRATLESISDAIDYAYYGDNEHSTLHSTSEMVSTIKDVRDVVIPEIISVTTANVTKKVTEEVTKEVTNEIWHDIADDLLPNTVIDGLNYSLHDKNANYTCTGFNDTTITEANVASNITIQIPGTKVSKVYNVDTIADRALKSTKLKSVHIPGTIIIQTGSTGNTRICQSNTSLTEVTLGEGLNALGYMMFDGCTALSEIKLPQSLEMIDIGALKRTNIKELVIPENISFIGRSAFTSANLQKIYFESSGKDKNGQAIVFENIFATNGGISCDALTDVYVPWSEGDVAGAPWGAPSTTTIHYNYEAPSSLLAYELSSDGTYYTLVGKGTTPDTVTEIVIDSEYKGKPVTEIGTRAFANDSYITSIIVPDSVKSIDNYAFENCVNLVNLDLGNGVEHLREVIMPGCSSLENLVIPDSVTYCGTESTFADCTGLKNVTIGRGLNSISMNMFRGCTNLSNVEIPNTIKYIDLEAFAYCTSLNNITIPDSVRNIAEDAFSSNTTVYVPWSADDDRNEGAPWGAKEVVYDIEPLVPTKPTEPSEPSSIDVSITSEYNVPTFDSVDTYIDSNDVSVKFTTQSIDSTMDMWVHLNIELPSSYPYDSLVITNGHEGEELDYIHVPLTTRDDGAKYYSARKILEVPSKISGWDSLSNASDEVARFIYNQIEQGYWNNELASELTFARGIIEEEDSTGDITFYITVDNIPETDGNCTVFDARGGESCVVTTNGATTLSETLTLENVDASYIHSDHEYLLKSNVSQINNDLIKFVATNIDVENDYLTPFETSTQFEIRI